MSVIDCDSGSPASKYLPIVPRDYPLYHEQILRVSDHIHPMDFQKIIDDALELYQKQTNNDPLKHPLATQIQTCISPSSFLDLLKKQRDELDLSRIGDEKWTEWIFDSALNILFSFFAALGAVGLVRLRTCAYLKSALSYSFCSLFYYLFYSFHR